MLGNIIVGIAVLLAVVYLIKLIMKTVKHKNSSCCDCCSKTCKKREK